VKGNVFKFRGMTLLEVMMALTIFLMLLGLVTYIYSTSARSWLKVRQQIEVKDSAQVTMTRIMREIRTSARKSVTVITWPTTNNTPNNQAISFLSSYDESSGVSDYDPNSGEMLWTKYIFFYVEDDATVVTSGYYQLFRREINIKQITSDFSTTIIANLPYPPIPSTPSTKTNPMSYYMTLPHDSYITSPTTVSRNITKLQFTKNGNKVEIIVNTGKPVNPSSSSSPAGSEKVNLRGIIVLRNSN